MTLKWIWDKNYSKELKKKNNSNANIEKKKKKTKVSTLNWCIHFLSATIFVNYIFVAISIYPYKLIAMYPVIYKYKSDKYVHLELGSWLLYVNMIPSQE